MENQEQTPQSTKPKSDDKEARDFVTGIVLRGAVKLQNALNIDEDNFLGISGECHHDPRAYYLYGVLDEVLKAGTAILRWQEFISNPDKVELQEIEKKENGKHLTRLVDESVQNEQHLWSRKLAELLSDLLLFESTNSPEHFRLFLTCKQLDAYVGLQNDFHEFFGCKNLNAQESVKSLLRTIARYAKSIDIKKVWFLNDSIKWDKPLKPGTLFRSSRFRYKSALEKADAEQKLALGISYEKAYSMPSRSIHASIGGPTVEVNHKSLRAAFSHSSILCVQIILQAHKLSGVALTGDAEFLNKAINGSDARKMMESVSGKDLEVGDIVFAYGKDLCIIVDKSRSGYGYTSYKVKYLTPPLIPEVPEDWFPARFVHLVLPKKEIREQVVKIFELHHLPTDAIEKVRAMPDKDLLDQMAKTALKVFEEGGFDHLFKERDQ